MLHAIVMAGGSGTRFWPASRNDKPKQLLSMTGGATMIQATCDRLGDLVPPERLYIFTAQHLIDPVRSQLPKVPVNSIVGEPHKRDTAPCIGLAAFLVQKNDPDATMVVMPSDHVISPESVFREAIEAAVALVDAKPERIVTFGIPPTYPAETFGYIERAESLDSTSIQAFAVKRFREKPKGQTAQEYFESGNFYWNAGIFIWKAKTVLDALKQHEPQMYAHLAAIAEAWGTPQQAEVFDREFGAIEGKSIDYAIMEHHSDIVVVEAPFNWDDVGNWQSMARLHGQDEDNNTHLGNVLSLDSEECIVRGEDGHLVVTLGTKELIIVHTPDATLVADKSREEDIRDVVKKLKSGELERYL
ncbi:mannose-1-phosphate guanylyltransferase [Blastopirellula marina]|uniref:mannose-1-phosphate guanylyltransferase n=1 Tax=Blastopirellula marina TaxID=124 RepID=A0A2S8GTY3_9BACT|nr:mannose-1-phosphate guanylyltransferase [Blastopirellula marina]PQO47887.1 mannose-1-phosphate guanylyltransferase [Blastopirellula marina]